VLVLLPPCGSCSALPPSAHGRRRWCCCAAGAGQLPAPDSAAGADAVAEHRVRRCYAALAPLVPSATSASLASVGAGASANMPLTVPLATCPPRLIADGGRPAIDDSILPPDPPGKLPRVSRLKRCTCRREHCSRTAKYSYHMTA
jgi:hypothetical protein